jgi:hypothetical protein
VIIDGGRINGNNSVLLSSGGGSGAVQGDCQ